jgi:predicted AAA+ superfamily ATPase
MKTILSQLMSDFHERKLPELTARRAALPQLPGKATTVIGMRRTGKTWFCFQHMQELLAQGVSHDRLLYVNFEDDRLLDFTVRDFQTILDIYYSRLPHNRDVTCFFFLDEIQRIAQWESFVRRLLDTERIQIVLTGSSSKLLSSEIATSLRGRSLSMEIFPFSFIEFMQYHKIFAKIPSSFSSRTCSLLRKAIGDYLMTGGFPEAQNLDSSMRTEMLQGYIDAVLLKDVVERHKVAGVLPLKHLVRQVLNTPGAIFSVNKFHHTLQSMGIACAKNSLYEYLEHLMDAYLLFKVPLHTRSERQRQVVPPKFYAIDTGLLQAMTFRHSSDSGPLLETLVYLHLRRGGYELEFVRTADGYEVDFLARHPISGEVKLLQVCYDLSRETVLERELRALNAARRELRVKNASIVSWDDEKTLPDGLEVVPVWKFLLR